MIKEIQNFKKYLISISEMDDASFHLCVKYLTIKTIKKGAYFLKANARCKDIAYIDKGLFKIFYLKDGLEVNTCFCEENSIVTSLESLVKEKTSIEYIQAIEDTSIITLSYENLKKLYLKNSKWQVFRLLLTERECLRLSTRVNALSFETAKQRYEALLYQNPEIIQRVSMQDIASYLAISRETLSRIRAKLVKI